MTKHKNIFEQDKFGTLYIDCDDDATFNDNTWKFSIRQDEQFSNSTMIDQGDHEMNIKSTINFSADEIKDYINNGVDLEAHNLLLLYDEDGDWIDDLDEQNLKEYETNSVIKISTSVSPLDYDDLSDEYEDDRFVSEELKDFIGMMLSPYPGNGDLFGFDDLFEIQQFDIEYVGNEIHSVLCDYVQKNPSVFKNNMKYRKANSFATFIKLEDGTWEVLSLEKEKEIAKQKALNKLTDEEKELLGL